MISLDSTQISTVVRRSDCPHWFAFRFSKREGWEAARAHELLAHPGATQATTALAYYASGRGGRDD